MPKVLEYPRGSLQKSLEIAQAVDALGGECSQDMCASKLGRGLGGAFSAQVSAATKYGFVESRSKKLSTTLRFRNYKLAYSDAERKQVLRDAFLGLPLFAKLAARFAGQKLPIDMLDKLLAREFDVSEQDASRIGSYFVEGARDAGVLVDGQVVLADQVSVDDRVDVDVGGASEKEQKRRDQSDMRVVTGDSDFTVLIRGPGMDSQIDIRAVDDLEIVEIMLRKIRRSLQDAETSAKD